jgi:uncharacterized protein
MQVSPLPAPAEAPQRSGTAFFFLVALGFTFLLQLPAVLAQYGVLPGPFESYVPLAGLGGFGPLLGAVLAARREAGRAGIRALFRSLRPGGADAPWFFVALLGFAVIYVAGVAAYRALGGGAVPWLYLPENPQHVVAMLLVPLVEELGWRGFALPRLQDRLGAVQAGLLLGVFWAAWHTMMFLLQGSTPFTFATMMVNIVTGSLLFSWLYNRTRGSLFIAVIAHVGVHLNNPTHALPGDTTPFVIYTVAIAVAALALVFGDRKAWQAPLVASR